MTDWPPKILRWELPDRRWARHTKIVFEDQRYHVGVGFARPAPEVEPCVFEIFISGPGKVGSARNLELADQGRQLSFSLQLGVRPRTLRGRCAEDPAAPGRPQSAMAAALDAAMTMEAEFLAEWRAAVAPTAAPYRGERDEAKADPDQPALAEA